MKYYINIMKYCVDIMKYCVDIVKWWYGKISIGWQKNYEYLDL